MDKTEDSVVSKMARQKIVWCPRFKEVQWTRLKTVWCPRFKEAQWTRLKIVWCPRFKEVQWTSLRQSNVQSQGSAKDKT